MGSEHANPATARPAAVPAAATLGILAGGAATRLAGRDKAWLERDGLPQVLRWQRRFEGRVDAFIVSANAGPERYRDHGIAVVPDAVRDAGPMAGLSALAGACATSWLLTLPVDLVDCNDCLLPTLRAAACDAGAWAEDDDGPQPLVALWHAPTLRAAAGDALRAGVLSVRDLQAGLGMHGVRFTGVRFGNLNTPDDLVQAGVA